MPSQQKMPTPNFIAPPIVELVLGVQFSPLAKLTSGHFGRFWDRLGKDWGSPADNPPLDDQFEVFDQPRWQSHVKHSFHFIASPFPGRFTVENSLTDRMIQIQSTRFHYNWRKRDDSYPSYKSLISEFEAKFDLFSQFVKDADLGALVPNQWELTYVDAFPVGEYWHTPSDWSKFLPGLFSDLFPTEALNIELENRAAEWTYEIKSKLGRLHISARPGRWGNEEQSVLLLQMTARGPLSKSGITSLRQGLDLGHEAAVGAFLRITNESCRLRWGERK